MSRPAKMTEVVGQITAAEARLAARHQALDERHARLAERVDAAFGAVSPDSALLRRTLYGHIAELYADQRSVRRDLDAVAERLEVKTIVAAAIVLVAAGAAVGAAAATAIQWAWPV